MALRVYLAETPRLQGLEGSRILARWYEDTDPANVNVGLGPQGAGTASDSTNLITINGHGLSSGQLFVITSIAGGFPLRVGEAYYVSATGLTANAFSAALSPGGPVIDVQTPATALTARRLTPPGNVVHERTWTLPRGRDIDFLLPEIDQFGQELRLAIQDNATLRSGLPIGTTRAVPA